MLDHLLAAHDPVGFAVAYAVLELSRQPELQRALREELRSCVPRPGFLADDDDDNDCNGEGEEVVAGPTAKRQETETEAANALDALPLLDAIMTETLRVHSPAPGPEPREVGKGGVVVRVGEKEGKGSPLGDTRLLERRTWDQRSII